MTSIAHAGAPVRAYKAEADPTNDAPLEPAHELPTAQPYKPSVGGWIGTGAGAAGGAVLGAGVGAFLGIAVDVSQGTLGSNLGMWTMLGVGFIGLVAGGIATYTYNQNNHDKREQERVQGDFGTSTLQLARDMISTFDHNDNSRIDRVNTTGLDSADERVSRETRGQSRTTREYDWLNDEWDRKTERWTETRGTSAAPLWEAADADPKDDIVSDVELARLMATYDVDRSGSLTTPEVQEFKKAHPLIVENWSR